jgi:hypothetical protein
VCSSYQQSAIAHGYVDSVEDVTATYNDMCRNSTASQCQSYFVVLTVHGYATHTIFDDYKRRPFMFIDYIINNGLSELIAEQTILQDLERCFCKSHSSLEKFGFPVPEGVPTELEEAMSLWMSPEVQKRQGQLLDSLNLTYPNNNEQQSAFDCIMDTILGFRDANRDDMVEHVFHFIGGPCGTGKLALFKKLHTACRMNGLLVSLCAATSLAALLFEGATTAHSLFGYLVEDETDVDDQNLATCDFKQECSVFLFIVSVIFWDEFISNNRILMEAVLEEFRTRWEYPRYFVFVCAGDFAQVRVMVI